MTKQILDFMKLLYKNKELISTIKHILKVFPEGVIIRVVRPRVGSPNHGVPLFDSEDSSTDLRFVNDTARDDFYDSKDPVAEHKVVWLNEFVVKGEEYSDERDQEEKTTYTLDEIMQDHEAKYRCIEGTVESQIEWLNNTLESASTLDSKYFIIKTIKVSWEEFDTAYMHVFVNSTSVKKLEKEKAMNKCLHIMFSSVSHEFRTPINAFSNALTLLAINTQQRAQALTKLSILDQSMHDNVSKMIELDKKYIKIGQISAKILLNLTEDILDLAKMQAGIFSLTCAPFRLQEVVEDICFIFELQCQQKGLSFRVEASEELLQSQFYSDAGRIKQVLMNLISNSYKFTNEGEVAVLISKAKSQLGSRARRLQFVVKDTGVGISQSDGQGLFQMFGMVHRHRDEFNLKGTGLGLTISQKLVRRLGGDIQLESEEGAGTEVTFTVTEAKRLKKSEEEIKVPSSQLNGKIKIRLSILTYEF